MKYSILNLGNRDIIIKASILLLFSYAFGIVLHCMIHELGHAFAVLIQGGTVTGFYFHPFNGGLNSSTYVPNHILLFSGGAFLGLPVTIIFMFLAYKYKSPIMFPLIMVGSFGFYSTGIWMIKSLFYPEIFTDYSYLIYELGVPAFYMLIGGIIYIFFGFLSGIFFLPLIGIDYKMKYLSRFTVFILAIIPWEILHQVYSIIYNNSSLTSFARLFPVFFYAIVFAFISLHLQRKIRFFRLIPVKIVKNKHFIIVLIAIIVLYTIMFTINHLFPIQYQN